MPSTTAYTFGDTFNPIKSNINVIGALNNAIGISLRNIVKVKEQALKGKYK